MRQDRELYVPCMEKARNVSDAVLLNQYSPTLGERTASVVPLDAERCPIPRVIPVTRLCAIDVDLSYFPNLGES